MKRLLVVSALTLLASSPAFAARYGCSLFRAAGAGQPITLSDSVGIDTDVQSFVTLGNSEGFVKLQTNANGVLKLNLMVRHGQGPLAVGIFDIGYHDPEIDIVNPDSSTVYLSCLSSD